MTTRRSVKSPKPSRAQRKRPAAAKPKSPTRRAPQVASGESERPAEAYLAALPGWQRSLGRRLDALIVKTVPHVRTVVQWRTPFYGIDKRGWFMSFSALANCLQVTFFRGAAFKPRPPGESTQHHGRTLNLHATDTVDEALFISWVTQAARLPGARLF